MPRRYAPAPGLALWALFLLLPPGAHARHGAAPFSENGVGAALASVQTYFIPARDGVALAAAADERSRTEGAPHQFADPVAVSITPSTHGTWESLSDGSRLWRLVIDAPGATDLNLGFGRYDLPPGATLHVIAPDHDYYEGPYTYEDGTDGQLWLPVTPGSRAVIEMYVPEGAAYEPELALVQVGYGFRDWFHLQGPLRQGSCNNDVVCPEAIPWRDDTRSEGVYQLGGAWTCSGQMINNTAGDFRPYFLTANHCGINAGNASSMVVYWDFESPNCGDLCCGSLGHNQTGAIWRASYSASDFTLVELEEMPDPAWVVYWSGWDNRGGAVPSVVGIHHPNCDEKAISFDYDPIQVTSYGGTSVPGNGTHWRIVSWDDGVTEPGSSGSGIWDPEHHLVGQLHGGGSSCSAPTLSDWYGRFSVSWTGGGTSSSRLRDWLDPGSTGALTVDGAYAVPPVPHLTYASSEGLDDCASGGVGDANGIWEPGEQVQVPVTIDALYGAFTNVTGTLSCTTPGVTILDGSATWPDIPADGSATTDAPHFLVEMAPTIACGTIISLDLDVSAAEGGPYHSTFTARVGAPLVPQGLPALIRDNQTTTSLLAVGQDVVLTDVNVHVEIQHSKVGNLKVQLQSPLGTTVTLLDRPGVPGPPGGCIDANMDITFDDLSTFDPETWCEGQNPWYAGDAKPVTPLSVLNGQSSAGTWKLLVSDAQAGNEGYLSSWELIATPALNGTCDPCGAGTDAPSVAASPAAFGLAPVRPNPFGTSAEIAFTLDRDRSVRLEVFDVTGRRVTTLLDREMPAGRHAVSWSGDDANGHAVAAGLYFVRLTSEGRTDLQRVNRLR
jgi:hypothetical protein